jgi:hypothetical protein
VALFLFENQAALFLFIVVVNVPNADVFAAAFFKQGHVFAGLYDRPTCVFESGFSCHDYQVSCRKNVHHFKRSNGFRGVAFDLFLDVIQNGFFPRKNRRIVGQATKGGKKIA